MGRASRLGRCELRRGLTLLLALAGAAVLSAGAAAATTGGDAVARAASAAPSLAAVSADSPAGFWYGTDSRMIAISGPAPYREPVIGGIYGGYIGMTGNWASLAGCHKIVVWSATNSAQANT